MEEGGENVERREGGVGGEGSGRKETDRSLVIIIIPLGTAEVYITVQNTSSIS